MRRFLWIILAGVACSNGPPTNFDGGPVDGGDSGDAPASFTLRVDPPQDSETVTIGVQGKSIQFHAYRKDTPTSAEVDVTTSVAWSIDSMAMAASSGGGAFGLLGVGGVTNVNATLQGVNGASVLTVKATGNAFLGGTDPSAVQTFSSATPDTNAANAPAPQYPLDGVVLPGNIPPLEFQWTQVADNNLYRVHVMTAATLDVYLYTTALDAIANAATWTPLMQSARDLGATWTVDATGPSKLLRTSTPRTMTPASDTIDDSAIYVWQSSTGTFHVLDMIQETDVVLPNNAPALQQGQPCSGCHRISRDGKRFAYTFNGGELRVWRARLRRDTSSFVEKIAPNVNYRATYATFNPLESSQVPAMLITEPDNVTPQHCGHGALAICEIPTRARSCTSNLVDDARVTRETESRRRDEHARLVTRRIVRRVRGVQQRRQLRARARRRHRPRVDRRSARRVRERRVHVRHAEGPRRRQHERQPGHRPEQFAPRDLARRQRRRVHARGGLVVDQDADVDCSI